MQINTLHQKCVALLFVLTHSFSFNVLVVRRNDPSSQIRTIVRRGLRNMANNDPNAARKRVARDLIDDLKEAGGFIDFSGTNLTQLSIKLGFEKDEEFFLIGDNKWGVSCGYDIEDTASILIPFSGKVKFEVSRGCFFPT